MVDLVVASCVSSVRNLFSRRKTAAARLTATPTPGRPGSHVVKVDGYSRTKGLGNGKYISSQTFDVGGHGWCLRYFPDGYNSASVGWISLSVRLDHSDANQVRADVNVSLLDQDNQPVSCRYSQISAFFRKGTSLGFDHFISRKFLEKSLSLRDDVLRIRCDITVMEVFTEHNPPQAPFVMPSADMRLHLGQLLLSDDETADVTFEVDEDTFPAHRCVLAARSSVFTLRHVPTLPALSWRHFAICAANSCTLPAF
jgi:speckle-type POZ protein